MRGFQEELLNKSMTWVLIESLWRHHVFEKWTLAFKVLRLRVVYSWVNGVLGPLIFWIYTVNGYQVNYWSRFWLDHPLWGTGSWLQEYLMSFHLEVAIGCSANFDGFRNLLLALGQFMCVLQVQHSHVGIREQSCMGGSMSLLPPDSAAAVWSTVRKARDAPRQR